MVYNRTQKAIDNTVLNGVLTFLNEQKMWVGTMTELGSNLIKVLGQKQSANLPGSPSALRVVLNRVVNRLRNRRVSVRFDRTTDHMRTRFVKLVR